MSTHIPQTRGPQAIGAQAAEAFTKPTFEGVTVSKDRNGDPQLSFKVQSGDTLSKLARKAGTDVDSLVHQNQIENRDQIKVGQTVALPTTTHEVKPGETYYGIAKNIGIDHKLLMSLNQAPPDGALRAGARIQVPAAVTTPEQAKTRADLKALIDDKAGADSKMYFGEGSFRPHSTGFDLGYSGVADSDARYAFSDDFKSVDMSFGQSGEIKTAKLANPVADIKKMVITDTIGSLAHIKAEDLKTKFPEFKDAFTVDGPTYGKDGTVGFVIGGPADGEQYITYDPAKNQLSTTDNSGKVWTATVNRPTDVVNTFAPKLGLKLPLYT